MSTKKKPGENDQDPEEPSLLDPDPDDGSNPDPEGDPEGDEDPEGDDDGEGAALTADALDTIVDRLEERLGARFDAVADRRVNALLKDRKAPKSSGTTPPAGDEDPEGEDPPAPAATSGQLASVQRETRSAAREYLSDQMPKFLTAEERELAIQLMNSRIVARAELDTDGDALGKTVADETAAQIKALRRMYEKQLKAALQRQGALVETPGQPSKQPVGGSAKTEFEKGAEIAARMRPASASQ